MFTKNLIQLTGNVAKDPETRSVGDTSVTRARLIHNDTIRKADGSEVERVVAVDLDIWGKRGEAFAAHINSKVPVYVEGRLQLDQWEQDGEKRSRLLVRVDDWQFLAARASTGAADDEAKTGGDPDAGAASKANPRKRTTGKKAA